MLLVRWKWPCTWWQTLYMREKERFMVLATFWKNDNSSCFWYTDSFNWKSSFVLIYYKSEDGYTNFLFSCLLLVALYTNSTYIIWLKKYSVVFYFYISNTWLLFVLRAIIFKRRFWHSLTGYMHQNHRHMSWYPSYFEKIIAVDLKKILSNFLFCSFIY